MMPVQYTTYKIHFISMLVFFKLSACIDSKKKNGEADEIAKKIAAPQETITSVEAQDKKTVISTHLTENGPFSLNHFNLAKININGFDRFFHIKLPPSYNRSSNKKYALWLMLQKGFPQKKTPTIKVSKQATKCDCIVLIPISYAKYKSNKVIGKKGFNWYWHKLVILH